MVTKHITITGKVQGVFFRKHTKQTAEKLNIRGWVRNVDDDKVEINAQGDKPDMQLFIKWCKQGPGKAEVKDFFIEELSAEEHFTKFSIHYND